MRPLAFAKIPVQQSVNYIAKKKSLPESFKKL
jgi:hypothetical protein